MKRPHDTPPELGDAKGRDAGARLIALLRTLERDLHPDVGRRPEPTLHSSLERDLGIDSLGRAELLVRMEREFDVRLPELAVTTAESVGDLLALLLSGESAVFEAGPAAAVAPDTTAAASVPAGARTLQETLIWHCQHHPERTHVLLYGERGEVAPVSYGALMTEARSVADGLSARAVEPGRTVAIMLPTGLEYLASFLGILLVGAIPVPIYPPARPSQVEEHLRRHARILGNAECQVLVTSREIAAVARLLQAQVPSIKHVVTAGSLRRAGAEAFVASSGQPDDIAFLQYTSGSTGDPKGVQLTHFNLLSNIRAMGERIGVTDEDIFVSWLPLYHDMGLIGAWLGSLYHACPLVLMSPLTFLGRPYRWLQAIHRHRGTLSAAPNFAYELCLSKVDDRDIEGLDLSSWRMAFNGAEPVSPRTIERFTRRFAPCGFRPEAMVPVYGLAESSVGLAFPPAKREPPVERVDRGILEREGRAVVVDPSVADSLEVVGCGQPLPGHQVRIVDDQGRELPERRVGRLQFQGPSATEGYFRNPEVTRRLFDGPWLETGDLAYIAAGDIYITSRVKDMIIRAGRNVYPHELEELVGEIDGIRKGCVAVFGARERSQGTERLVVLAETRETDEEKRDGLRERVRTAALDLTGVPADEVVLVPPQTVLKTSSGKVRRAACRERYERGMIAPRRQPLSVQYLRIGFASLAPAWRRLRSLLVDHAFALYAWSLFLTLALLVWTLVALLPRRSWRWSVIRRASRLIIALTGVGFDVRGAGSIPGDRPVVLVSNHASYLDGLLLVAGLPGPFVFVAKSAFQKKFIPRTFLRRLGTVFVERFDPRYLSRDLERLTAAADAGSSLVFFPEGTFMRMPGLLPFRSGAFLTAAQNGMPVVPVALKGSRSLLRADSWFPRRVAIGIEVLAPVRAEGEGFDAALRLRDRVRALLLDACGEPDLSGEFRAPASRD